jgi:hypothetical protein
MTIPREEVEKLLEKYKSKLEKRLSNSGVEEYKPDPDFSKEYSKFKNEATSTSFTNYEKLCNFSETIIKVAPSKKDLSSLQESIKMAHINISPNGAASFAILISTLIIIFTLFTGVLSYFLSGGFNLLLFSVLISFITVLMVRPITLIPKSIASKWRLRVSDQMVLCILYIVIYMRHTSNFENAIKFAGEHIDNPLALDIRKIFWDVNTGKYTTLKESLENYLNLWRNYNLEFVNSFHLLESSLYESNEEKRLELLNKSLDVILEGTYDRMTKYAHGLQNPITMLHMLGVILPILGLVIFPLIGTFLGGVKWYYLAILYNLILPVIVYNAGMNILSKRPAGYGELKVESHPKKGVLFFASFILILFIIIGLSPFIIHKINPNYDFTFFATSGEEWTGEKFLDFECANGKCSGPFGLGALILSFFIPLGLAIFLSMYYKSKSFEGKKIRERTKKLEQEFSTGIFQLGTRIGDGIPTENAFRDISKTLEGTPTGNFFKKIHYNIISLGMSLKNAIFNKKNGAINDYPSPLVKSSMKLLVESAKKSPSIVSQSLLSISAYVKNVRRVSERLKDLLAEIISSMKSQINFMAPVIAGIVVGIASMIVGIISKLGYMLNQVNSGSADFSMDIAGIVDLFQKTQSIPGYFFQIVVGVYVVQVVYILTVLSNGIEFGADKLNEQYSLGKNILRSVLIYVILALVVVLIFNRLASGILGSTQI